ncbi:PhlD [Streptomyces sp. NBC_01431]|uniref:PhlD n=1 Tax=Streptomyces sp. NBC_01431 TaxID=2903863 RepID=UPI002E360388|nr:PhlD [Streptomyces sp. NBC_01431]
MQPSYVSRPTIFLPEHKISTDEIISDIEAHHPNHPRLRAIRRVIENTSVTSRRFTRPLESDVISGTAPLEARVKAAFFDALEMAERAARQTLDAHGLTPADIDAVITSHSTSWGVPQLDIQLIRVLGMKPTTRPQSQTTLACAGGTQSLIRAAEATASLPRGAKVLVVVSEVISSVYNHADDSIESMVYKALFGDSAGACIVSDTPLGPGLRIEDTWQFVLPNSIDRYTGRMDATGLHFDSTKEAPKAAAEVMGPLLDWLGPWRPTAPVIHPGAPGIINDVSASLGLGPQAAKHSRNSLAENGNLGGVAVLDVLRRTHDDPPASEDGSLVLAFGPGFSAVACRGTWLN